MRELELPEGRRLVIDDKKAISGDLSDLFEGTHVDPKPATAKPAGQRTRFSRILELEEQSAGDPVLVKISKSVDFNDLLEREAKVLAHLHPHTLTGQKGLHLYYPRFYGSLLIDGKQANILAKIPSSITLVDVLEDRPEGIDYRDMAWMIKRVLVGTWNSHLQGIVHGAILPPHVLLTLNDHGGRLIDWSYSTVLRSPVPAMLTAFEDYYPPEVPQSQNAREGTDIYMVVKCAQALVGGDLKTQVFPDSVPKTIRSLFELCLHESVNMRPLDASKVHDAFDKLLKEVVGKPTFRPFSLTKAKT